MDTLQSVALAAGLAWGSGIRLYAVLFIAGLMARLGYVELPPGLGLLTHPAVLSASGFMLFIEFFADKIPGIDSLWDAAHTFVRIPAGALLAALALADQDPALVLAAAILGGSLASAVHLTKTGSRALINASPEPFSNWTASFGEEALLLGGLWAAFTHPLVFLAGLAIFLLVALWLLPKIWRGLRVVWRGLRAVLSRQRP
ncbi:MAG: DUF4126 domain-containing protein [Betaproteobacteria bacterium]|nr:MAG: DUF4126 domain-containing protein [Betaproteobacteria bacterium]